jgi:hypothetical protein
MGARFAFKHEGNSLVLVRPVRDFGMVSTYTLDGTRVTSRIPGRLCEGEPQTHETVAWEGDALVLTVIGQTPPGATEMRAGGTKRIFRFESPDRLVVEATMMQSGQPRQVGFVYRRSNDPLPPPRPALPVAGVPATIGQLAWLGTTWVGTTGQVTTEERWTPAASGGMLAVARTLRGTVMASFEFLCIAEREGTLVYIAMPDARMPPTFFALTQLSATSAQFENPGHDYPKIIRYALTPDGSLETTISGAGGARPQSVVLKKQ